MKERSPKAWVVAVHMGIGHLRAAFPLRDIAEREIIVYGSRRFTPAAESRRWRRLRWLYYIFSRAGTVPVIGRAILGLMLALEKIPPLYPRLDRSAPNLAVRYLEFLIRKRGLCAALVDMVKPADLSVVHTFYATAVALDLLAPGKTEQYLLICDADINRVWVPARPEQSHLTYLAPCTQVKQRLLSYGVREERIKLTGFPLPKENLGTPQGLEILKEDLFARLLRLDPKRKFFSYHRASVLNWLDRPAVPESRDDGFHVTFAIGGAGAQLKMAKTILRSLANLIKAGRIRIAVSCGIRRSVFEQVLGAVNGLGLEDRIGREVDIVFDQDVYSYLKAFNVLLRRTDVLWTKPSELSFYCALGLPILMAPPIGTHEERNRRWLGEIHAGVEPSGEVEDCREWLLDLRENGRLAEAAWDGFLKARKLGTYKIETMISTGEFVEGQGPLEQ